MGPTGLIEPIRLIVAAALSEPIAPIEPSELLRLSGPIAAAALPRSTAPLSTAPLSTTTGTNGPTMSSPPSRPAAVGARAAAIGPSAGGGPRRMPVLEVPEPPGSRSAGPVVNPTPTL